MKKNLLKTLLVAAGMVMGVNGAWAEPGDEVNVLNQTFTASTTLESTDDYTWGSELKDMLTDTGLYVTNNSNKANNYENRDFLTFTNAIGDETHEVDLTYEVYNPRDKGQSNTYYTISYFNNEGELMFSIQESSGGWAYGCNVIYATGTEMETVALPKSHISKGGGSEVKLTVKFSGKTAAFEIDGQTFAAYTKSAGIKAIKLSVTGENGYDRDMYIKNYNIKTTEIEAIQVAGYTLNYVVDGVTIKDEGKSGTVGESITLTANETAAFKIDDNAKKYIYVSDDANGKTIAADGSTVITLVFREASIYNYSVVSSQGGVVNSGSTFEDETLSVGYPHYQLIDGTLYAADAKNKEYRVSMTVNEDNTSATVPYNLETENIVFYSEAEDIEGLETVTYGNVAARASKALAAKATEDKVITTLPAGKYVVAAGVFSSASSPEYIIKIGVGNEIFEAPVTVVNASEVKSGEFIVPAGTTVTLYAEGMGDNNALDYIYIQRTGDVTELPITLSTEYEYSTYCNADFALDFTDNADVKAYAATVDEENNRVVLTEVMQVPAGEGVVLKNISNATSATVNVIATAASIADNAMVGVKEAMDAEALVADNAYILNANNKFHRVGSGATNQLAAGKAYLRYKATEGSEARLTIVIEDSVTAVADVTAPTSECENVIYNLQGVRVQNMAAPGLYIVNGKTVVVK